LKNEIFRHITHTFSARKRKLPAHKRKLLENYFHNLKMTWKLISQKQPNIWFTVGNLCVPCLSYMNFLLI